jgi:hypothetical protein
MKVDLADIFVIFSTKSMFFLSLTIWFSEDLMKRISIFDTNFKQLVGNEPRVPSPWRLASVNYDRHRNCIVMEFANGVELSMPVNLVGELYAATADGLAQIHLSPSGEMVVVEQVDAHIGTKGLIETALSVIPATAMAASLGASGGARSSVAKRTAAAENGKKGGRPRKDNSDRQHADG